MKQEYGFMQHHDWAAGAQFADGLVPPETESDEEWRTRDSASPGSEACSGLLKTTYEAMCVLKKAPRAAELAQQAGHLRDNAGAGAPRSGARSGGRPGGWGGERG